MCGPGGSAAGARGSTAWAGGPPAAGGSGRGAGAGRSGCGGSSRRSCRFVEVADTFKLTRPEMLVHSA